MADENEEVLDEQQPEETPPVVEQLAAEDFLSIRDAAKQFGYEEAASFEDDEAALKHLIEKAQSASAPPPKVDEQLSLAGRRYLEHASDFEEFLRTREQEKDAAAKAPADEPKFWEAPEWNPAWLNQVETDPDTGQLRPVNGGSLDTVQRVQRYLGYRQDQQERFWSDPFSYIDPYISHREQQLQGKVRELIDQRLEQERLNLQAQGFIREQREWLYEKDAEGNIRVQYGNDGQPVPVLTEEGQRFAGYVNALKGTPPDVQQEMAMRLLEADRVLSGKKAPDAKREEKNKQILLKNAKAPSRQSTAVESDEPAPVDIDQLLRASLKDAGIDDEKIARELMAGAV